MRRLALGGGRAACGSAGLWRRVCVELGGAVPAVLPCAAAGAGAYRTVRPLLVATRLPQGRAWAPDGRAGRGAPS